MSAIARGIQNAIKESSVLSMMPRIAARGSSSRYGGRSVPAADHTSLPSMCATVASHRSSIEYLPAWRDTTSINNGHMLNSRRNRPMAAAHAYPGRTVLPQLIVVMHKAPTTTCRRARLMQESWHPGLPPRNQTFTFPTNGRFARRRKARRQQLAFRTRATAGIRARIARIRRPRRARGPLTSTLVGSCR